MRKKIYLWLDESGDFKCDDERIANNMILYSMLHRCCAETLLELSADRKYLGATPGI